MINKKKIKLVTHDNRFHADDVLATATLLILLGEKNCEVIRTRDDEVIKKGDYVYDVGCVYDPSINRFDHHQDGIKEKRENGLPYSSFGLVWEKFGEKICGSKSIADFIDRNIVQSIDALDNTTDIYKVKYYGLHPQTFNRVISSFLPTWLESFDDKYFIEAVDFAKKFLTREIKRATAREKAKKNIEKIYNQTKNKKIIVLDKDYPHEDILNEYSNVVFVVKPKGGRNRWLVEALRDDPLSFDVRKSFPLNWAGKNQEELSKLTGIEDALFCHRKRFVTVAKSQEGAIKLAELALKS